MSPMSPKMAFVRFTLSLSAGMTAISGELIHAASAPKPITSIQQSSQIRDVRLNDEGMLQLQLLNSQGQGLSGVDVSLMFEDRTVATGTTDKNGALAFRGLRPGIHVAQAGAGREILRLWNHDTAPPQAINRVAIVSDEKVVRGQIGIFTPDPNAPPQGPGFTFGGQLLNPLTVGAIAIGTVAVVKAIDLQDEVDALRTASP
ncbi:MAG: hypothetical protein ACK526_07790 [Planctomyces sp.]